jgi:hypothetical protein
VWHLRQGSTHPCARQFSTALAAVLRGSKVLLILGEIDCREGLLTAVEKCKVGESKYGGSGAVCVCVCVAPTRGVLGPDLKHVTVSVTALVSLLLQTQINRMWADLGWQRVVESIQ